MSDRVFILDTSALLWFKRELPDTLPDLLDKLTRLVTAGISTFPRQVRDELFDAEFEEWAKRCWRDARRYDVDRVIAREVFAEVEDVIDYDKTTECADPWLVAQAVEFMRKQPGTSPAVVSNDFRSNTKRRSVQWACQQYDVEFVRPAEFLLLVDDLVTSIHSGTLFDLDD